MILNNTSTQKLIEEQSIFHLINYLTFRIQEIKLVVFCDVKIYLKEGHKKYNNKKPNE